MKKVLLVLLFLTTFTMNAQDFEDLLKAGATDTETYLGNYLEPVFKGIIYDLSGGWYHSAKVHNKFGFDLTLGVNLAFVPEDQKNFIFNNADYTVLALTSGLPSDSLPTAMGGKTTKEISVSIPTTITNPNTGLEEEVLQTTSFNAVNGFGEDIEDAGIPSGVPLPMVQIGVGLPLKTDVKIRYVPETEMEEISLKLFGIGLQHDLLQHFSKKDSKFDLSLLGAFTKSTVIATPEDGTYGVNQEIILSFDSYTAQIVAGFDLKYINFYAGLGYVSGSSSVTVNGDYSYTYEIKDQHGNPIAGVPDKTITLHDPIQLDYSVSGAKATVGMRLNIGFLKVFADYTFQGYDTANIGVAFSFDKKKKKVKEEEKKEEIEKN